MPVVDEGAGVVSIEVEGEHLDELRAEAGQFFRWRFLTPDTWLTAHPFSLSAPPTGDRLRLTVKALGAGSTRLQSIAVGTWVVAEGPYGAMTAARRIRRNVLLVAGGVGITPMRALFETMPLAPGQDLTLLYRARDLEQVLFRDELEMIARRRGARPHYLLGRDPDCLTAPACWRACRTCPTGTSTCAGRPAWPRPSDAPCSRPGSPPSGCTRNGSRSERPSARSAGQRRRRSHIPPSAGDLRPVRKRSPTGSSPVPRFSRRCGR